MSRRCFCRRFYIKEKKLYKNVLRKMLQKKDILRSFQHIIYKSLKKYYKSFQKFSETARKSHKFGL